MKRIVCLGLILALTLGLCGVTASAAFGVGAEVVASECEMIKTGILGEKLCFSDTDVKCALCISGFKSIKITRIPASSEGTLLLAGRRVKEGQTIKRRNIAAMVFVPASREVKEASFGFTVDDAAGGAEIGCRMRFVEKVNYAPVIPELGEAASACTTQAEISVFGRLLAEDPEGDALEFITVSYPKYGTLTITDKQTGSYKYTPEAGYTGYDRFVYVARDEYGNYTPATTVSIKVTERMSGEVFADMTERQEYNAAVAMSALGVMSGTVLGDDCFFNPDTEVTRAEFVAMAVKAYGIRPDSTVGKSFFDDDGEIPAALRGYVATAQRLGIADGEFTGGRLLFSPNSTITKYEAANILSRLLGIAEESEESVWSELYEIPVWARGSVGAMVTLGIIDAEPTGEALLTGVTRADAAELLYRMLKV